MQIDFRSINKIVEIFSTMNNETQINIIWNDFGNDFLVRDEAKNDDSNDA